MAKRQHGGARKGAGRKRKADEQDLIEKLDLHINPDAVIKKLRAKINKSDFRAIQLYLQYRFGKPVETIDLNQKLEDITPVINVGFSKAKDPNELDK